MNKNGLELCPFCGNDEVKLEQSDIIADIGISGWSVECSCCQASGPHGDLKGARGQWNCWTTENKSSEDRKVEDVLRSKCQKLFLLLDRNTNPGPPCDQDTGECYYCEKGLSEDEDGFQDDELESPKHHKPDCAWRQAREFIENERDQECL